MYLIILIIAALWGIVVGFRKGISGQLGFLLAMGFGIVTARIFAPLYSDSFMGVATGLCEEEYAPLLANILCAAVFYAVTYAVISISNPILNSAMSVFDKGMLNRLAGAFFGLVNWLLWVSIAYNILICIVPGSSLLYYEKSDDGNLVGAVMAMTPAFLGCYGAEDMAHRVQLHDASFISRNFNKKENVILISSDISAIKC